MPDPDINESAIEDELQVFRGDDGDWHWRRVATNGEIISRGEGYTRLADAEEGARRANPDLEPQVSEE